MDVSYSDIRAKVDEKSDPYLYSATAYGQGIRILRQENTKRIYIETEHV